MRLQLCLYLPPSVLLRPGVVSDFNYAREPNVDERNKLSRDIYRVEDSQLAEAVQLLEQRCPDAVVRVSKSTAVNCDKDRGEVGRAAVVY